MVLLDVMFMVAKLILLTFTQLHSIHNIVASIGDCNVAVLKTSLPSLEVITDSMTSYVFNSVLICQVRGLLSKYNWCCTTLGFETLKKRAA